MSGERPVPLLMAAAPSVVADVPAHAPGDTTRKLTPGALALWELERAEVRARNAALLAQSVAAQRAEIAGARAPMLARAKAQEAVAAASDHRAKARQWAAEHPGAADRLPELQAEAKAKAGEP